MAINPSNRILALAGFVAVCAFCFSQTSPEDPKASVTTRDVVDSIVHRSAQPIRLSDSSSPITITSAGIAISAVDLQQIKQYGERAIPVLSTYLLGPDARSERVAIRLLGVIGGPATVDPLSKVLSDSSRPASREEALRSLEEAPCSPTVARAIRRLAQNDPNTIVRQLAQKQASSCSM